MRETVEKHLLLSTVAVSSWIWSDLWNLIGHFHGEVGELSWSLNQVPGLTSYSTVKMEETVGLFVYQ